VSFPAKRAVDAAVDQGALRGFPAIATATQLANWTDQDTDTVKASVRALAQRMGESTTSTQRALHAVTEAGVFDLVERGIGKRPSQYRLASRWRNAIDKRANGSRSSTGTPAAVENLSSVPSAVRDRVPSAERDVVAFQVRPVSGTLEARSVPPAVQTPIPENPMRARAREATSVDDRALRGGAVTARSDHPSIPPPVEPDELSARMAEVRAQMTGRPRRVEP
jgi:hypothetical protein